MSTEIKPGQTWKDRTGPGHVRIDTDPSKVKAGDTLRRKVGLPGGSHLGMFEGRLYTVATVDLDHGLVTFAGMRFAGRWEVENFELVARAADHQPAPEPEPEWKPGTTGTAHIVSGDSTTKGGRVFRKMRGMVVHRPAPIDDDMFVTTEGELWRLEGEYCKNFVPDEPKVPNGVVIDPAAVDVDALLDVQDTAEMGYPAETTMGRRAGILAILAHLGIEAS